MGEQSYNYYTPVVNRPETILAVVITFLLLAWMAISLRLYVRLKSRLWGWDDMFVFGAGISTTVGSSLTCLMPDYGLGRHFWTLDQNTAMEYFKHIWSTNLTYVASTTFIKLAILCQYLRLFDMQSKVARVCTWMMIALTASWGITFFLLALFSCRPIAKNWNFTLPGTCVAWGSKDPDEFFATWAAHSASNMALDMLVLVLPIPFLKSLRVQGKTRIGLIGLFAVGGVVAALSLARMVALCIRRAGTVPVFDPSFNTPSVYIFSVLEINIAIACASIPIFWPFVSSLATNKIFVVNEIEVRTDRRNSEGIALAEQGANIESSAIPDFELEMDKGGRTSRTEIVGVNKEMGGRLSRTASKLTRSTSRHQKSKPSTSSSNKDIELSLNLARQISGESQQNLATKSSNGALSYASSSPPNYRGPSLDQARNGSVTHYEDRYVAGWVVPDFDKGGAGGNSGNTYTTTVERAEIPFDHIKALDK